MNTGFIYIGLICISLLYMVYIMYYSKMQLSPLDKDDYITSYNCNRLLVCTDKITPELMVFTEQYSVPYKIITDNIYSSALPFILSKEYDYILYMHSSFIKNLKINAIESMISKNKDDIIIGTSSTPRFDYIACSCTEHTLSIFKHLSSINDDPNRMEYMLRNNLYNCIDYFKYNPI